jgi:uncharacterized protein YegP (UPF0339 family)
MYFQVVETTAGYHARIRGDNHEIVFSSQVYGARSSAINAITMVQTGASTAPIREVDETR